MQNNNISLGIQVFRQAQQAHAERRYAEAVQAYNRALALIPTHPQLIAEFARLTEEVGDWNAARTLYARLGELRPDCGFEGKIGQAFYQEKRFDDAVQWLRKAAAVQPGNPDIHIALAASLAHAGDPAAAGAHYLRAHALRPDIETLRKLLAVQINAGDLAGADATIELALRTHAVTDSFRAMAAEHLLKAGRYGPGFDLFHARPIEGGDALPCTCWDGRPFTGTLLVTAEQGLGDEILASSLYADLVTDGVEAVVECDPRLLPVLQRSLAGEHLRFVARGDAQVMARIQASPADWRKIRALDLCRFYRREPAQFPARTGWLQSDPARRDALRAAYRARWPGKRLVGISWRSMRTFHGADLKSLQLVQLPQLLGDPHSVFISLQYGNIDADLAAAAAAGLHVERDTTIDATGDIDALFAQAGAMDLVISTSSTTVHVASSQGQTCWVALPDRKAVPWYWAYTGQQTPWYPAATLFRHTDLQTPAPLDRALANALGGLPPVNP